MSELVSLREYARRRGVSAMAVSKAAKAGRITLVDGKVDVAAADRDWLANTNPGQMAFRPPPAPAQSDPEPMQSPPDEDAQGGQNESPESIKKDSNKSGAAYGQARAIREGYAARLAKLDYEKEIGSVVSADAVRVLAFKAARTARDQLLSLPDRLAPVLAGEADEFKVHQLLSDEIRRVCDDLSNSKPV
jgi:hypothetical protein